MNAYGKDAGLFAPQLRLRPSRLFTALLLVLAVAALMAAGTSNLPLMLRAPLLLLVLACLLYAGRQQTGPARLREMHIQDQDENTFLLRYGNGSVREARYAGYALLGTRVVFMYFTRAGWQRIFGAQRIAIVCDAVDADSFRRLRAWVRLA